MHIIINYDSCWQASFLEEQHNASLTKRKFIATSKSRGETVKPITKNTVMGVLCRLIGDQRKLYEARNSNNYFFTKNFGGVVEDEISFDFPKRSTYQETMYITNKSDDRCSQSIFLGVISDNNPYFFSQEAKQLWSVLFLSVSDLLKFILNNKAEGMLVESSPKKLIARVNLLIDSKSNEGVVLKRQERLLLEKTKIADKNKQKLSNYLNKLKENSPKTDKQMDDSKKRTRKLIDTVELVEREIELVKSPDQTEFDTRLSDVIKLLSEKFIGQKYIENGAVYPMSLYAAALYLQAERMLGEGKDVSFLISKKGKNEGEIAIQGFSKRGFNGIRDWLNPMTGKRKKAVGTPCTIQKQSGILKVTLDVKRDKAKEIKSLIENAGVSSFYLGKKGLAYVTNIDTREVR